ncbi:MAG TPA: CpsB/CapC family capsule biosynthesis tyrosine phosphatase [Solirubrobacteraceae bacterium]|nr:CpsB/CapC family capsule biosynthesis tyrosine phosphatase [Solirubrobacteraceae bacterium]
MTGTIDLHCHLLPGLDDGARDVADAVAMARQAQTDGVCAICTTPHIRADHAVVIDELAQRRRRLSASLRAARCRVRVLPGGEVAATMVDSLEDRQLVAVALGGSGRWILLEPPPGPLDGRLQDAVDALHARGFRALIAHPERHGGPDLITRLAQLIARGALVQATADYFTDPRTRPTMLQLAQAGVIHVLGSDSHSSRAGRPVVLSRALEALHAVDSLGGHLAWVARTAPYAIVRGEDPICPFSPRPVCSPAG